MTVFQGRQSDEPCEPCDLYVSVELQRKCGVLRHVYREVADRIMGLREHISKELLEELTLIPQANTDVKRK